ncbi:MAG TPA: polysaccharide biosynthesis tyrosine autokinase [Polyangia bacterium]|nr:polysaccharide biosynthesis tyrosine autokinase [Polyangia bacterium]
MADESERIDVGQIWATVRDGRRVILLCAAAVLLAVSLLTIFGHMRFKAHGSLYLGELQGKGAAGLSQPDQFELFGDRGGDVGTEIEILKSHDLLARAIQESGFNVSISPVGWSPPRYWRWRLTRRRLDLLDPASEQVIARDADVVDGATEPRRFIVAFLPGGAYQVLSRSGRLLGEGALGRPAAAAGVRMTLLAGPAGAPPPGTRFEVTVRALDDVADGMGRVLSIGTPKTSSATEPVKVVSVDFSDPSPRAAAAFVAALMRAYLDRRQSWKSEEATAAETFVTQQVRNIKDSLDRAEQQLADYKRGSPVVVLGDEAKGMIDQLARYEEQRVAAQLQVVTFNQIDEALKHGSGSIEQFLVGEAADQVLAGLSGSLAQAEQELTRMHARFTDDAPALREQQAQVDMQVDMIKKYVAGRRARAQDQLGSLNRMIGQFEDKLRTVPSAEQQLTQLTRNSDVLSKMYSLLLEKQQQAAVVKASTISKNHVLDVPVVPRREDSPLLLLRLAIGALLGLLVGALLVAGRRLVAVTFQTEKELRKELGALPVFGALPYQGGATHGPSFDVFAADAHSPFAEAFRHLRTNIYYSGAGRTDKVLLITSPSQGDGKTLCTLSLAAALAADRKQVLVVEADMHRPSHFRLFGAPPEPGLSAVLTRQVTWKAAVRVVETAYGTFDAIPAGEIPPSPAELLSSPVFGALLAHAKTAYDYVLVDAPPFPLVSDALVISMYVDRVLSVVRLSNTPRRLAEEHLTRFSASTPRLGVVMNGVSPASPRYRYGRVPAVGAGKAPAVMAAARAAGPV